MARLTYISTNSVDVHSIAISPGQIMYCGDLAITYYDTTESKRMQVDNVQYCYTETDRLSIPSERLDKEKLYVVTSKGVFYRWSLSTDWVKVLYTADIYEIFDLYEHLVPSTIVQFGTKIAPRTLATEVFTRAGERVQEVLDDITRIGKTYRYIDVQNTDGEPNKYKVSFPFKNYLALGNFVELYVGDKFVTPKNYTLDTNADGSGSLTFNGSYSLPSSGEISLVYTYNTSRIKDTVFDGYNGNYIIEGTIPLSKMEKYSDNYLIDDPTSIATSKAVYNLYNSLNEKVNLVAGNLIAYAVSYNTASALKTTIENYTLVDNSTIYLTLHTAIARGATLSVNGGPPIPIYLNQKDPVNTGLVEGDILSLTYSKLYNKFFVNSSIAYRLNHYQQTYECVGGDSTIAVTIGDYEPGFDSLHITHNNLKLVRGVNYDLDGHNIILRYTPNAGDIIEIEMDKVAGNGLPLDGNTIMKEITFTENVIFRNSVRFDDHITLPNGGYITKDGDMYINGDITAENIVRGDQLESTTTDKPPLIIHSTEMCENLNADMVDGYHEFDLARPDSSIEFIIDGESDIMDPVVQIALRSFLGRLLILNERLVQSDNEDLPMPEKRSYVEEYGYDYEWDPNEYMFNENVRDTLENVVYELDMLRARFLVTQTLEDYGLDETDLNEMEGSEFTADPYAPLEVTPLYNTWAEMAAHIDYAILELEVQAIKACDQDTHDKKIMDDHLAAVEQLEKFDPEKYLKENMNPDFDDGLGGGDTQASALRGRYLLYGHKRFYPITHRNAIVGLPFGNLATEKSVVMLQEANTYLDERIKYLEDVIQVLLSGGGSAGGSTGALVKLAGQRVAIEY